MLRIACALGLAAAACGDAGVPERLGDSPSGLRPRDEQSDTERDATGASLALEECVKRHVESAGSERAVTSLVCPGPTKLVCDEDRECSKVADVRCDGPVDLASFARFKSLTRLDLSNRCVADVGPLAKLAQLEELELSDNQIEDLRPLGNLVRLRKLGLARNPLAETWGATVREPFSRFSQLVELNLDETYVAGLLPLTSMKSLQVLHLRNARLRSLRPLGVLTTLRELHVDGNEIEDLTPLRELRELEEFTANANLIWSIASLQQLAESGRLRSVSLDGTCVDDCQSIGSAQFSCREPMEREACVDHESTAPASAISVPVRFVERGAPVAHLPVWTNEQVSTGFSLIASEIDWSNPTGNCDARAAATAELLAKSGYPDITTVWAFGNLRALTTSVPAGFVAFDWHVAPAVRTEDGIVVLDPAFEPRPLALREWFARLVNSRGADLNFSCRDNQLFPSDVESRCTNKDTFPRVDARGDYVVDQLDDLRGSVCWSATCTL